MSLNSEQTFSVVSVVTPMLGGRGTMTNSEDSRKETTERYFEVDFEPDEAFSFECPTDTAIGEVSELLRRLPVRPFVRDPLGQDTLNTPSIVGEIDEIIAVLE